MTFVVAVLLVSGPSLSAQEQPADKPEAESEVAKRSREELQLSVAASAREFVGRCEFTAGEAGNGKLALHPEPILRWSNPTAGTVFGEVFVWTDNGRPAVIASWYRWFSPDWGRTLEVCSLADSRMSGRLDDVRFWNTEKPGLTFKPLANADAPAKTPAAKLVQMRRLAGDFVANLADTRGNDSGVKRQLRLLTQPIFRYPAPNEKADYSDGALFAFVEGTDPEAFLLLEATKSNDDAKWRFGLVRMNSDALRITFRDKEVWSVPKIEHPLNLSKEPYVLFTPAHIPLEAAINDKKAAPATKVKP